MAFPRRYPGVLVYPGVMTRGAQFPVSLFAMVRATTDRGVRRQADNIVEESPRARAVACARDRRGHGLSVTSDCNDHMAGVPDTAGYGRVAAVHRPIP
ncbi:hypothetical protein GCM10009753_04020 [Streptantibioticus ferralitis]